MELVNEAVIRELSTKTTLKIEDIKQAFCSGRELWLDGRKAVECGLVNELIDEAPQTVEYKNTESTKQILALVAQYKHNMEANMEEEKIETTAEETEIKPEAEEEITEVEKEEIAEEVAEELTEKPEEIDFEAECEKFKAENEELKKELEALKALVAKYNPVAKPTAKVVKAGWLEMVRELNAKHLSEIEYAKEYKALKNSHIKEFEAFMKSRTTR